MAKPCPIRTRSRAHDHSVEIWIQEYQVIGENSLRQRPAAHYVESLFFARVRLLLQREPEVIHPR